ncbi:MAG: 16S rRNA processing protein RimM [Deltaproteobacteria bacterium]|nr:MAG: 16S rRNA processing protein RimM [Deltaproteobacteria bacterium]
MQDPLVVLGEIVKAQGLRGEAKVRSEICDPENFLLPELLFRSPDGTLESVQVLSYRAQKGAYVLRLAGFSDISQVQARIGWELVCYGSQLPVLPSDEYYHFQLIGLPVFNQAGGKLGCLREIMTIPPNEVYVIKSDIAGQVEELLLPAVGTYIKEIDLKAGRIVVDPVGTQDETAAGSDSMEYGE